MKVRSVCIGILLALVFPTLAPAADTEPPAPAKVGGTLDNAAVWQGEVLVERTVTVPVEGTLAIRPGARVRFTRGAALVVHGTLQAEGTPGLPVLLDSAESSPARGDWAGVTFDGREGTSRMRHATVRFAEAVRVSAGEVEFSGCAIEDGVAGVVVERNASARIAGSAIGPVDGHGVDCQAGSKVSVDGCTIRGCGQSGVVAQRNSAPVVTRTSFSGCDSGIWYASPSPPPEGNRFDNNKAGIVLNNAGGAMAILGNRFTRNEVGIHIENFSSPRIEGNDFRGNGTAIFCLRSSSPRILRNRIAGNRQGIVCSQLSAPRVEANEIAGNGAGVVLAFSSYAVVNGNNFDNNAVQMRLDDMSHDWEVKSGRKPERGTLARELGRAEKGVGLPPSAGAERSDAEVGADTVDATGNWWGEKDTAEMAAKGPDADISTLLDAHDVPVRSYEGYPGEYRQDRIRYDGWKAARIPDAGLPAEEEGGR